VLLRVVVANPDGLPSVETLEAVESYTLQRTDRNDWIELSTDGERMRVEVEKKEPDKKMTESFFMLFYLL
jgi:hypothetical protein